MPGEKGDSSDTTYANLRLATRKIVDHRIKRIIYMILKNADMSRQIESCNCEAIASKFSWHFLSFKEQNCIAHSRIQKVCGSMANCFWPWWPKRQIQCMPNLICYNFKNNTILCILKNASKHDLLLGTQLEWCICVLKVSISGPELKPPPASVKPTRKVYGRSSKTCRCIVASW